jgi:dsRNA-specific ribonuclease
MDIVAAALPSRSRLHVASAETSDSEESVAETQGDSHKRRRIYPASSAGATPSASSSSSAADDDIRVVRAPNGLETYVFDPYNPLNVEITQADVEGLLRSYGIPISVFNMQLYRRAFIHKSYLRRPQLENEANGIVIAAKPDNCLPLHTKSNERLEFVGDGVLECVTKFYLYQRFSKAQEGFMTEKKIELVKNESIGRIAFEMGLHKWFVLSKHAEDKQTRTNLKKLGCLFEAFVGAIFLDFNRIQVHDEDKWFDEQFKCGPGFQMAQLFIEAVFERHVDWTNLVNNDNNFKNILQVIIQKEYKVTPHHLEIRPYQSDSGYQMGVFLCLGQPIHEAQKTPLHLVPVFGKDFCSHADVHAHMSVHHKVFVFLGEGTHRIKKKAEQIACEMAIQRLKEPPAGSAPSARS